MSGVGYPPFCDIVHDAFRTIIMTAQHAPDDTTPSPTKNRAVEHLYEAIEAEEMAEKNFRIKQALQLPTMNTDR